MKRHNFLLIALAGFLALGVTRAVADADVDGMDHSRLNHGVLGQAAPEAAHHHGEAAASASASAKADPDVDGMDHSKLNHGVLGAPVQQAAQEHTPHEHAAHEHAAPAVDPHAADHSHKAAPESAAPTVWKSPTR